MIILAWNWPDAFLDTGLSFLSLANILNWSSEPATTLLEADNGIEPQLYGIAAYPLITLKVYYWLLLANKELTIL